MTYWLDYSAAKLSGPTIKYSGYGGAIRYIDAPNRLGNKHTNKAEYNSLVDSGLAVRLVMEVSINDADGAFTNGVLLAQRAKAGADYLGYPGVIYFCNDRTTLSPGFVEYLRGAASVLGWARIGAYGFQNAMDAAKTNTPCQHFWQSGRRSEVRSWVQIWQDNNTQVQVGGITCDRNLILQDISENDLTPEEHDWLHQIQKVLGDAYSPATATSGERSIGTRIKDIDDAIGPAFDGPAGKTLGSRVKDLDERPLVDAKVLADALIAAGLTVAGGASVDQVRQIVHDALNSARLTTG